MRVKIELITENETTQYTLDLATAVTPPYEIMMRGDQASRFDITGYVMEAKRFITK